MKVTVNRLKRGSIAFVAVSALATILLGPAPIATSAKSDDFDAAPVYKAKCAMCHGPKAEKKFDATLPGDQLAAIILSGKKGEKPPNMPEFQTKGITADQATALVTYMKSLKQ